MPAMLSGRLRVNSFLVDSLNGGRRHPLLQGALLFFFVLFFWPLASFFQGVRATFSYSLLFLSIVFVGALFRWKVRVPWVLSSHPPPPR